MKLICILKCSLYFNSVILALEVDHVMDRFQIFVQIPHKTDEPLRLMKLNMFHRFAAFVFIYDCQIRI